MAFFGFGMRVFNLLDFLKPADGVYTKELDNV
jgi:hypothetical protein